MARLSQILKGKPVIIAKLYPQHNQDGENDARLSLIGLP